MGSSHSRLIIILRQQQQQQQQLSIRHRTIIRRPWVWVGIGGRCMVLGDRVDGWMCVAFFSLCLSMVWRLICGYAFGSVRLVVLTCVGRRDICDGDAD
mmetsp:Transcript_3425/g.8561  ORF Transcript_3425/g.8561 Transcript_3425/m.8561 type:complete len:98 (-) Transcript_3425:609-902(-)